MNIKERWITIILPYVHRIMEMIRNDPDCTYDEWKQVKQNYKDTVGKDYERTN